MGQSDKAYQVAPFFYVNWVLKRILGTDKNLDTVNVKMKSFVKNI